MFYSQVLFYTISLSIICFFIIKGPITVRKFISTFPIVSRKNWYVTTYFAVLLVMPFLNVAIFNLKKETKLRLIIIGIFLFSIISTIFCYTDQFNLNGGYSLLWYCFMYFCGSYIKEYGVRISKKFLFIILLLPLSKFLIQYSSNTFHFLAGHDTIFYNYNSFPVFLASIIIFNFFVNLRVKTLNEIYQTVIRLLGKTSFAVFYLHSFVLIRDYLWVKMGSEDYLNSVFVFVHLLVCITLVYFICSCIEILRMRFFEITQIDRCLINLSNYLDTKYSMNWGYFFWKKSFL